MPNDYKSFIEVQFPVSKISKESYKERKAGQSQTLTGLGKWWGRKPLILVRASILGLLMPSSDNLVKDREIFLKILTMDDAGLWLRKDKSLKPEVVFNKLTHGEKRRYFKDTNSNTIEFIEGLSSDEIANIQRLAFNRMGYDEKLRYCLRPEEISLEKEEDWQEINDYLGTNASNITELIQELGVMKFGKTPNIGDCFCGGGSIPFEASRIGCDSFASDLNPIASLLTWSALNITGGDNKTVIEVKRFVQNIFDKAEEQVLKWGIEKNEEGWRANSYLYCNEIICPECGYKVPLSPSWVVGSRTNIIAILISNHETKSFNIEIKNNATKEEVKKSEDYVTIDGGSVYCPHCKNRTSLASIRKDHTVNGKTEYGLPMWEKEKFLIDSTDIFQERLYCIKYDETIINDNGSLKIIKHCTSPTSKDVDREKKVLTLIKENFYDWQERGFIPSLAIEEGYNTNQIIRERGWTHWHQLYNPRQLLMHGLLMKLITENANSTFEKVIGLLAINRCCNFNSRLSKWRAEREIPADTFYNQALNTLYNYGTRGLTLLRSTSLFAINNQHIKTNKKIKVGDARENDETCDLWITDPPYADAINYHELSEFFLTWDKNLLIDTFPEWYADSKRVLAVRGTGETFNNSMIEIYKNLANHMPDKGMQIVMFTHQDVKVWAELTMILWSAGLRVVSAWNIATETESGGLKDGNYVKGTVLLVLKKQTSNETAFQDDIYPEIKAEVKRQIDSMRNIDEGDEPNFSDADYLLASYASSLKVLTTYKQIEGINVQYELSKDRNSKEVSPIEEIINKSIKIAYDYLIPIGFDQYQWKLLSNEERFYIKGLELEKNKSYQLGAYQELARGYGVNDYKDLFENTKANNVRLKTPMEFKNTNFQKINFGSTLTRNVLMALYQSVKAEDTTEGKNWLRAELGNMYWKQRNTIVEVLNYLSRFEPIEHMEHWQKSSEYAKLLKEVIKNDGV